MTRMYARAVGLWTHSSPGLPAWLAPYAHAAGTPPRAARLPPRAAARASLLTRMFAEVIGQVTGDDTDLPIVFGSGNGELQVTGVLLGMMNRDQRALSPARFQASVHNTAAGVLSIAQRNRAFSTCLAAGPATAAACFEEAASYLALHGGELVIALADEAAPEFMASVAPCQPLALALRLSTTPTPGSPALQLTAANVPPPGPFPLANPCAAALPLWAALLDRPRATPITLCLPAPWPCAIEVSA